MIAAGFLRKCIPLSTGGESAGLTDTAIMVEELYAVNASCSADADRNRSWTIAALDRRHGGAAESAAAPILETSGGAAGGVLRHRTGGQCQCRIATAGRGRSHHSEVLGRQMDHPGPQELGFLGHGLGSQGLRPSSWYSAAPIQMDAPAERGISIILRRVQHQALSSSARSISVGHRAHLLPQFALEGVSVPGDNCSGKLGGGLALTAASFMGAGALVGVFAVGVMRTAFDFALGFARNERRGGIHPIIEHQAVGRTGGCKDGDRGDPLPLLARMPGGRR